MSIQSTRRRGKEETIWQISEIICDIFGKVQNVDVLQAKSPIKVAVKSGSKLVEKVTLDNDIIFLIISVIITFIMLYSIVKLLKSLVLEKIEAFFDQYIFDSSILKLLLWYFISKLNSALLLFRMKTEYIIKDKPINILM